MDFDSTEPFRPYGPGTQPPNDSPAYRSTGLRHPSRPLVQLRHTVTELSGPQLSPAQFPPHADLSRHEGREAMG